ncbi:MAG: MoaD/ThiS family protein [Thermoproteales archaeon]|nr:MoaD/ThiS family protein [Thermoproteales archaeon]
MTNKIRVTVKFFSGKTRVVEVEKGEKISGVLKKLGLNPIEVIVIRGGTVIPDEETVDADTVLEVFSVISGG